MKVRTDTEVAVLTTRTDLDLAISTWLPGYVAQRTEDLDSVMAVARRGGVVLIDLGASRHDEWLAALRDRGFDGPMVFLDPQGEMTIDLSGRVVVSSPPSLSGLLAGFEEAQHSGRGHRRRRGPERPAPGPAAARRGAAAVPPDRVTPDRGQSSDDEVGAARRARRLEVAPEPGEPGRTRARRSDRRHATHRTVLWRSRRGRTTSAAAPAPSRRAAASTASRAAGGASRRRVDGASGRSAGHGAPGRVAGDGPGVVDDRAEAAFQAAFLAVESQPAVERRIATAEGRIRVQTDEELFAGHPTLAAPPTLGEPGTVLTPAPRSGPDGGGERGDLTLTAR